MTTHGALTESSLSHHRVTHDRKGREGKGREQEGNSYITPNTKCSLYTPPAIGIGR